MWACTNSRHAAPLAHAFEENTGTPSGAFSYSSIGDRALTRANLRRAKRRAAREQHVGALAAHGGDIILRIGDHVPVDASHAVELLQEYADDELVPLLLWRGHRTLVVKLDLPAPN